MFTKLAKQHKVLKENELPDLDDEAYAEPFNYRHLGSLAYIGNSCVISSGMPWGTMRHSLKVLIQSCRAAFDYKGYSFAGGLLAMYAWRS
jgi:NADH dehydrogenase